MMKWILLGIIWGTPILGVVLFVLWRQRCPRCKSIRGPKGVTAKLLPENRYWVKRMCRVCGHTWDEETEIDVASS
jgi:predicted Zn-ribbon and HTH transcriptional regulator